MKTNYLCPNHVQLIAENLEAGKQYWRIFMARGETAYSDCRWDAAEIYLHAAIDVATVRMLASKDQSFSFYHILHPLKILCDLYISDSNLEKAKVAIAKVRDVLRQKTSEEFVDGLLRSFEGALLQLEGETPEQAAIQIH